MDIACICPPKATGEPRHDHDTVTFRERLDFRGMLTVRNAILVLRHEDPGATAADAMAALTETYLLSGIVSWSLVDAKGKPIEVTKPNIREHLLSHPEVAFALAEEADALYSEAVSAPLAKTVSSSSPSTPTNGSTSVTNGPSPKSRTPSKRSSTSTTPTGGIAAMHASPGGASSSSQS